MAVLGLALAFAFAIFCTYAGLLGIGLGDEYFSLGTGFENIKLSIKRISILESLVQKQVPDSYFPPILK